MGFDFGNRRIGVAVGSQVSGRAQPLASVANRAGDIDWPRLSALVTEWQPGHFIVGLPLSLQGEETAMSEAARQFVKNLNNRFNVSVELVDERLTSSAARDEVRNSRRTGERRRRIKKEDVDPVAACLILETWLNELATMRKKDEQTER